MNVRNETNKDYVDVVGKILIMNGSIEKESALINDRFEKMDWVYLSIIKILSILNLLVMFNDSYYIFIV